MIWHHPKYYKEMARRRKELERQQANKPTSPQVIKRPAVRESTSAECDPNH